jgi:streptogramin lyase
MVEETTVQDEHKGGKSRFALGFIAASALWVVLIVVVIQYWKTPVYRPPTSAPAARQAPAASAIIHDTPGARQSVAALVAQRLASLQVPVRKAILPSDLALQAEGAIKHGDFATASLRKTTGSGST